MSQLFRRRWQRWSRAVPLADVDLRPVKPSLSTVAAVCLLEGEVGVGRDPADVGRRRRSFSRGSAPAGVAVADAAAAAGATRVPAFGQPHFRLAPLSRRRHGR